nr:hypothetical protein [Novosphingobium taihuense]
MILFLVTASALAHAGNGKPAASPTPPPAPVTAAIDSEPVAVWSPGPQAPSLAAWLAQVGDDPRLEVRIVVRYASGARAAAIAQAVDLAAEGGARAARARILVEPGERAGASVALVYSREALAGQGALAR